MKVVFVGSNPSVSANNTEAFHKSSKSGAILATWIDKVGITDCMYTNVCTAPTTNNRPLKISEIKRCLPELKERLADFTKIIALGKTAARALTLLRLDFFEAPHPSGLNRLLNDKEFVNNMLQNMKKYVEIT